VYSQIVAVAEAVLHPHYLTKHLLLAFALQVPKRLKVLSQHPDGLHFAPTDTPRFHVLSLSMIAIDETQNVTLFEFG